MNKQSTTRTTNTRKVRSRKGIPQNVVVTTTTRSTAQSKRKRSNQKRSNRQLMTAPYLGNFNSLGRMNVSPCTIRYAKALCDPFNPAMFSDVCLPDLNSVPSFKFHTRIRGALACNDGNFGYITVSPLAMANSSLWAAMVSNTALPAYTKVPFADNVTDQNLYASNSPFTAVTVSVGSGLAMPLIRPVIAAVRIRYTGTELNRGGSVVPFKAKSLGAGYETMAGQDYTSILTEMTANPSPVDRRWHTVVWTPVNSTDADFKPSQLANTISSATTTAVAANRKLGFLINSTKGNTFEFDVVTYFEAIPQTTVPLSGQSSGQTYSPPSVSKSDSDPDGYGFVRDLYATVSDNVSGNALWQIFQTGAKAYYKHEVPLAQAFVGGVSSLL